MVEEYLFFTHGGDFASVGVCCRFNNIGMPVYALASSKLHTAPIQGLRHVRPRPLGGPFICPKWILIGPTSFGYELVWSDEPPLSANTRVRIDDCVCRWHSSVESMRAPVRWGGRAGYKGLWLRCTNSWVQILMLTDTEILPETRLPEWKPADRADAKARRTEIK